MIDTAAVQNFSRLAAGAAHAFLRQRAHDKAGHTPEYGRHISGRRRYADGD